MSCRHSLFEIFLEIPPISWIIDIYQDISIYLEFKIMKKKGYESYIGARYDKKGNLIASGVVCWRKIKNK